MKSSILFLDDQPSLHDTEISKYFVENIKELTELILDLKKIRPDFKIHLNTPFFQLKISENHTLKTIDASLISQVRDELLSLKTKLQKSPYSIDNNEKINDYWHIDISYMGKKYDSLIWAYLLDTAIISFKKNLQNWNASNLNVTLSQIDDEGSITKETVNIRHINCSNHIDTYSAWLGTYDIIPEIDLFLSYTDRFLSQIILLDEAKNNLKKLLPYYQNIYSTLTRVNLDLIAWDRKSELNLSIKNAKSEHPQRADILKKLGYEGYEAHFYFTGIAGRIHYRIHHNKMEIKYIGKKIGT